MEFSSFEEVVSSASSMLVSMFEAIFDVTLKEVIRTPSRRQDYVANAQTVVKACQELIKVSLPITGEQICQGDANAIRHMLILMIDTGFLIKSDASREQFLTPLVSLVFTFKHSTFFCYYYFLLLFFVIVFCCYCFYCFFAKL